MHLHFQGYWIKTEDVSCAIRLEVKRYSVNIMRPFILSLLTKMSLALSSCYGPEMVMHLCIDSQLPDNELEGIENLGLAPNKGAFLYPCNSASDTTPTHWSPQEMFTFLQMLCTPCFDSSCFSAARSKTRKFCLPSEVQPDVPNPPHIIGLIL